MSIHRIESLVFGANDVAAATRYFKDWGLDITTSDNKGADFTLPENQTILFVKRTISIFRMHRTGKTLCARRFGV